jgi:hypothetical protein
VFIPLSFDIPAPVKIKIFLFSMLIEINLLFDFILDYVNNTKKK